MKTWVNENYPEKLSYDQLRQAVREAWEQITPEFLGNLIAEMPRRCQAVINADGVHTQY